MECFRRSTGNFMIQIDSFHRASPIKGLGKIKQSFQFIPTQRGQGLWSIFHQHQTPAASALESHDFSSTVPAVMSL